MSMLIALGEPLAVFTAKHTGPAHMGDTLRFDLAREVTMHGA